MFFDNIRIKQDCYLNRMVNLPGRLSIFTFWFVISYMLINYILSSTYKCNFLGADNKQ